MIRQEFDLCMGNKLLIVNCSLSLIAWHSHLKKSLKMLTNVSKVNRVF